MSRHQVGVKVMNNSRKSHCPLCGAAAPKIPILVRDDVPVLLNVSCSSYKTAAASPRGSLLFYCCRTCMFMWNAAYEAEIIHYNDTYENDQTYSSVFNSYVSYIIEDLIEGERIDNLFVVEVGCGQGYFLRRLVEWPNSGIIGVGFDPAYKQQNAADLPENLTLIASTASPALIDENADVVISRHVIEHIPEPKKFIEELASLLSEEGRVFIETPCAEWILNNQVFWDFSYEHCSMFTVRSLGRLLGESGFCVEKMEHRFDGQYLWAAARKKTVGQSFASEPEWKKRVIVHLQKYAKNGDVVLWGAGGKGANFVNMIDPDKQIFKALIDINPKKQGAFIPGSGHPVLSPEAVRTGNIGTVFLLNPNYRDEIIKTVRSLGSQAEVIVLSPEAPESGEEWDANFST